MEMPTSAHAALGKVKSDHNCGSLSETAKSRVAFYLEQRALTDVWHHVVRRVHMTTFSSSLPPAEGWGGLEQRESFLEILTQISITGPYRVPHSLPGTRADTGAGGQGPETSLTNKMAAEWLDSLLGCCAGMTLDVTRRDDGMRGRGSLVP